MSVRRSVHWLSVLFAAALLAACGEVARTGPAGETPAPTAATNPTPPPATGGTLSIAFEGDIASLDPAIGYDSTSFPAERLLYDSLVGYDSGTNLIPMLASEMPSVSADGRTYTFILRPGVKFVNSDGSVLREMTADDVVHSLNRILNPNLTPTPSPVGPAFFTLIEGGQAVVDGEATMASGIRALDSLTVEIKLVEASRAFLNILALPFGSVVPKELAGQDTTAFSRNPVGTGPFYLASYKRGEVAIFKRNEHYWREGFPKVDTIEYRLQVDANTQLQQVQTNQLDIMGNDLPAGAFAATVNDPNWKDQVIRQPIVAVIYLAIDTSGPNEALANVTVRQAIAHAIDKDNILQVVNGRGIVAGCLFPTQLSAFDPSCNPYPHDVDRAKALMQEADQESGFTTQLYTDTSDLSKSVTESIVQDLAEIGITVELIQQDFDVLLGTITTPHQAPLVHIGWFQDFPDASDFYDPLLSCVSAVEGGANTSWYCREELDRLAADARRERDEAKRNEMYRDLQRRMMADVPLVPLYFPDTVYLVSKRIQGTPFHPAWLYDLTQVGVRD